MEFLTFIGLICGAVVMVLGILTNGSLMNFFDLGSIFITFGGTVAALLMNFPLRTHKEMIKTVFKALFSKRYDLIGCIDNMVKIGEQARKGGLLSIEEMMDRYDDEFLKNSIMLIVDNHEPQKVREILETELVFLEDRHSAAQSVLEKGAQYAPAFGMLGTLIGLINMLKLLDEPDTIGPNMSIALVTTFYGVVLANLVFLPLAGKLKVLSQEEMLYKQIIIEGVISIQAGENPRLMRDKLISFISPSLRKNKRLRNTAARMESEA